MPSMIYPDGPWEASVNEDVIECGKRETPLAGLTVDAANCTLEYGTVEPAVL